MLPTDMAPIYAAFPICPTMLTSISPSSGTVTFDTIDGKAIANISLSNLFILWLLFHVCKVTEKEPSEKARGWILRFSCLYCHTFFPSSVVN